MHDAIIDELLKAMKIASKGTRPEDATVATAIARAIEYISRLPEPPHA